MKNNKSLGKGLSALLGQNSFGSVNIQQRQEGLVLESLEEQKDHIIEISISDLGASIYQPRKKFDDKSIEELSHSIKEKGIIQPILVRKSKNSNYEIVAGERRYRAAKLAGLLKVPAIVKDITDSEVLEIAILENIQRENLTPIEEAVGYKNLIDMFGYTQEELSKIVSKSRTHVTNVIRLLSLDDKIKGYIDQGLITLGHAKILVGKPNAIDLAKQAVEEELSVRQLEAIVYSSNDNEKLLKKKDYSLDQKENSISANKHQREFISKEIVNQETEKEYYKDDDTINIENMIIESIGLKTHLVQFDQSKGKLTIYYNSPEELDGLIQKLTF